MKGVLTTLLLGAALADFGLAGSLASDASANDQVAPSAYEQAGPTPAGSGPDVSLIGVGTAASIDQDISAGVRTLDRSMRRLPGYTLQVAEKVEEQGIAGLAYSDPALARVGHEIGTEIGTGIRHFAVALVKDMTASTRTALAGSRQRD